MCPVKGVLWKERLAEMPANGGVFFIDRNGKVFEHLLEYLRVGSAAILPLRLHQEPACSIMLYQVHEEAKCGTVQQARLTIPNKKTVHTKFCRT